MKRALKGLFCSFLSVSMMAQYCLPIFAEDYTNEEEIIETENEEESVSSEDLLNRIDTIEIQERETINPEVKVDVVFNDDSNISDVSLNVKNEDTIQLE